MKLKFLFAGMIAICVSCKKDNDSPPVSKSVIQLLTQKEWILKSVGFDDNRNNILDDHENTIADCQKDNSYIFNANGSGKSLDNATNCGSPINTDFTWSLPDNDTALEIGPAKLQISRINENDLVLISDIPGLTVPYILLYGH